jgi:hypothetical protein
MTERFLYNIQILLSKEKIHLCFNAQYRNWNLHELLVGAGLKCSYLEHVSRSL